MIEPCRLMLLMRQPPYSTSHPQEAIEIALVAAAFDIEVTLLFEGAGVWQLLKSQHGAAVETRTQGELLATLPLYEIDQVYVCAESLAEAGLGPDDLVLTAQPLSRAEQRALIAAHTLVVND